MTSHLAGTAAADLVRLLSDMPDPASTEHVVVLERDLATRFRTRHAVAVSSGTAALHTAVTALGIGSGDQVLVPALSVVMSVAPVVHAGARPVFVDCNTDGTDFDYDDLTANITPATKAIMPVHLWGRAGDLNRLTRLANEHHLRVIEDACQAQGTQVDNRQAGTHGAVGCFSLKDGKLACCGEGGYLLTDNDEIADSARSFRSHGQPPPPTGPAARLGHNYRLAEPLAVIARANLARFDDLLTQRQHQADLLHDLLAGTPGLMEPLTPTGKNWNGYSYLATVTLPDPRAFCEHLARCGVPNSVGTFRLIAVDHRPELGLYVDGPPSRNAAAVIDHTLAVVLTEHDDDQRLTRYAQTITREAHRWRPHT